MTVTDEDWISLRHAADCAGMDISEYVAWGVRVLAMQAQPGSGSRQHLPTGSRTAGSGDAEGDESEASAWVETFTSRLSGHVDRLPMA